MATEQVRVLFCEWLAWILRIKRPGRELNWKSLRTKRKIRQLRARKPPSASLINNVRDVDNMIPIPSLRPDDVELSVLAAEDGAAAQKNGTGNNNVVMMPSYASDCYSCDDEVENL